MYGMFSLGGLHSIGLMGTSMGTSMLTINADSHGETSIILISDSSESFLLDAIFRAASFQIRKGEFWE